MNTAPIEQWINHQPNKTMATFAAAVARTGCYLPKSISLCRKQWPGPPPDSVEWLALYRDHDRIVRVVNGLMPGGPDTMLIADATGVLQELSPEEIRALFESMPPEEFQAAVKAAQEQAKVFHSAMASVAFNDVAQADKLAGPNAALSIEHRFYMLVVLPYVIEHGDWPKRDFESACCGDTAAIERLLIFDPTVITVPMIAKHIAAYLLPGKKSKSRLLGDAIRKEPPTIKVRQSKILMAALIVALFENAGMAISVADIRALFDAIAKSDKEELVDSDLPDSPEAMSKGIQRYKKFWRPLVQRMTGLGTGQKSS